MGRRASIAIVCAVAVVVIVVVVQQHAAVGGDRHLHATTGVIPSAPLSARESSSAVWTGNELIVWGGHGDSTVFADGAAFDPDKNRWHPIASAPLAPRTRHVAVWTGHEMIVWGGTTYGSGVGDLRDGAAYDPTTDRWRAIATAPTGYVKTFARAIWVDGRMVVGGGSGPTSANDRRLFVYDAAGNHWSRITITGTGTVSAISGHDHDVDVALVRRGVSRDDVSIVRVDLGTGAQTPIGGGSSRTFGSQVELVRVGGRDVILVGHPNDTAVGLVDGATRQLHWLKHARTRLSAPIAFDPMTDGYLAVVRNRFLVTLSTLGVAVFDVRERHVASAPVGVEGFCGADASVAWTGREFLAWGGQSCDANRAPYVALGIRVHPSFSAFQP